METKKFKTINEIEKFLKKHPEMKTGFINVGFEKKQDPVDGEVEKLEAMQGEIIAIQMELSEIKRKHPCIDIFEAKFIIGAYGRFDCSIEDDNFVTNISVPTREDEEYEIKPDCKTCAKRGECFDSDFDINKSNVKYCEFYVNSKAVKNLKSAIRKHEMADKLRKYADWLEDELKENR